MAPHTFVYQSWKEKTGKRGGVARLPTSFGMDYDDAKFFTILTELSRQWSGGVGVPAKSGEERLGTPPPRRG